MRKDKKMTLSEHFVIADSLAIATHHLNKIFFICQDRYPKSGKLMKLLYKVLPGLIGGVFSQIKCELDEEWHKLITDKEFNEYGHIYYHLNERFTEILARSIDKQENTSLK